MYRECPHCKEDMRRDADTCPHCHKQSQAWSYQADRWWSTDSGGHRRWLDEKNDIWVELDTDVRYCTNEDCEEEGETTSSERCEVCGERTAFRVPSA